MGSGETVVRAYTRGQITPFTTTHEPSAYSMGSESLVAVDP